MAQVLTNSFAERLIVSELLTKEEVKRSLAAAGHNEQALADFLLKEGLLTRFQVRQLRAGSTSLSVGNYVVLDFVGRGGNGIVLKAYHRLMPKRYVAIKTVDTRNLHSSTDAIQRFRREIEIVSQLDHPNVVRALDVIQTRTHLYLVLEYVTGSDLGRMVQQHGALSVSDAVNYGIQTARGLKYAHQRGIVHRDLKPTNLLLTDERIVKISDMGLARFFQETSDSELSIKGLAIGTPEYMAPEQAEDATSVEPRSDLYSLGATLFYLLTGIPSVHGSSYLHKLQALLTAPPTPLNKVCREAPKGLGEVVDRLRSRNPADRPSSAEETIELLMPYTEANSAPQQPELTPALIGDLVVDVLSGRITSATVCQRYDLSEEAFAKYQQQFLEGGRQALDPSSPVQYSEEQLNKLHAKIGCQQLEIEEMKKLLQLQTSASSPAAAARSTRF